MDYKQIIDNDAHKINTERIPLVKLGLKHYKKGTNKSENMWKGHMAITM